MPCGAARSLVGPSGLGGSSDHAHCRGTGPGQDRTPGANAGSRTAGACSMQQSHTAHHVPRTAHARARARPRIRIRSRSHSHSRSCSRATQRTEAQRTTAGRAAGRAAGAGCSGGGGWRAGTHRRPDAPGQHRSCPAAAAGFCGRQRAVRQSARRRAPHTVPDSRELHALHGRSGACGPSAGADGRSLAIALDTASGPPVPSVWLAGSAVPSCPAQPSAERPAPPPAARCPPPAVPAVARPVALGARRPGAVETAPASGASGAPRSSRMRCGHADTTAPLPPSACLACFAGFAPASARLAAEPPPGAAGGRLERVTGSEGDPAPASMPGMHHGPGHGLGAWDTGRGARGVGQR